MISDIRRHSTAQRQPGVCKQVDHTAVSSSRAGCGAVKQQQPCYDLQPRGKFMSNLGEN
jgi:hypothetical protein